MTKYIAVVDFRGKSGFEHYELEATDLLDAMSEAELYSEGAYLINIAEKFGKAYKHEGASCVKYREILTNRIGGWNATDEAHGEHADVWVRHKLKNVVWFDIDC